MAQPNPAPPQTKSFILGIVAAVVVVALALAFVMKRGQNQQAATQSAPPPETVTQPAPAATNTAPPVATVPDFSETQLAAVPRISVDNVLKEAPKGIVVIDVRDAEAYLASHIDGALHIPAQYLQGEMPYLPKDRPIITYCTWPAEESSARAALILQNAGFQNVAALKGGFEAWTARSLPVVAGDQPTTKK